MFLVKMGEGEIAEMALRLDKQGKLIKNKEGFQKPKNMRFRIHSNGLREMLANPDFNVEEYLMNKRKNKNVQSKIPESTSETKLDPDTNGDSNSCSIEEFEFFKALEECIDVDFIFDGWEAF